MQLRSYAPFLLLVACKGGAAVTSADAGSLASVVDAAHAPPSATTSTTAAPATAKPLGAEVTLATDGAPFDLHAEGDVPSYCDAKGAHGLDGSSAARTCKKAEPESACPGGSEVTVRSSGPRDIIDLPTADSVPLDGHVTDCAGDASTALAVATSGSVSLLVGKKKTTIDKHGADRVALGAKWIVWSTGSTIRTKRR